MSIQSALIVTTILSSLVGSLLWIYMERRLLEFEAARGRSDWDGDSQEP